MMLPPFLRPLAVALCLSLAATPLAVAEDGGKEVVSKLEEGLKSIDKDASPARQRLVGDPRVAHCGGNVNPEHHHSRCG